MIDPAKYTKWIPNDGQHPRDTVRVHIPDVSFSSLGGGIIHTMGVEEFLANYQPAPEKTTPLYLEYFCFDDMPWLVGFTNGRRWNGWECPLIEKSCLLAYIDQDEDTFIFNGDSVRHAGDNEEPEWVQPQDLLWQGEKLTVYDLGDLGLTWNSLPIDTNRGDSEDPFAPCNAILPKGWGVEKLKPT